MGKKSTGNVVDMVTIGITILAMSIVVSTYLECTNMMLKKLEISQLSRQYILKMETQGYLNEQNKQRLLQELHTIGVQNIDLSGTTMHPVSYGDTIFLEIRGTISTHTVGEGEEIWNEGFVESITQVEESRQSTAKN